MRHIKSLIFLVLLSSMVFLPTNSTKAAGPPDQKCASDLTANTTMIRSVSSMTKQTFKPVFNRLSRVTIRIKGDGLGKLGMGIAKGDKILAWNIQGAMAEPNGAGQTMSFEYNDLVLEPDQEYTLFPRISTDNNSLFWYYDYNCYDRGAAYIGAEVKTYDFDFATYGFTEEGPPVSALDLDEDVDVPADTPVDQNNPAGDTPVSNVTTPSNTIPTTNNTTSQNSTGTSNGAVEKTKTLISQIPFMPDESNDTNPAFWYVAGAAGLAVFIAIVLFIYLRIKKKKQNTNF